METAAFGERFSKAVWWPQIPSAPVHILLRATPPSSSQCKGLRYLPAWYLCFKRRFYYFCYSGISLFTRQLAWPQPETASGWSACWDPFFPPFKAILFFSLFFKRGGGKLQQINRTINFLIYLLENKKKKKEKKPQCEVTETPEQAVGKHSTCKIPTEVTPQAVGYLEIDIFNFLIAQ